MIGAKNFIKYVRFEELDRISLEISEDLIKNMIGDKEMTESERLGAIKLFGQISGELKSRRDKML